MQKVDTYPHFAKQSEQNATSKHSKISKQVRPKVVIGREKPKQYQRELLSKTLPTQQSCPKIVQTRELTHKKTNKWCKIYKYTYIKVKNTLLNGKNVLYLYYILIFSKSLPLPMSWGQQTKRRFSNEQIRAFTYYQEFYF